MIHKNMKGQGLVSAMLWLFISAILFFALRPAMVGVINAFLPGMSAMDQGIAGLYTTIILIMLVVGFIYAIIPKQQ
jgi:hypothetical protein